MSLYGRVNRLLALLETRPESPQEFKQHKDDFLKQFLSCFGLEKCESLDQLTKRIHKMTLAPEQTSLWTSAKRFISVPAGRRSGKTELAKRKLIYNSINETKYDDAWFIAAAPTLTQAKRIYWRDLVSMVPKVFLAGPPIKSGEPTIQLYNGSEITVMGMEVPERAEGRGLNGIILDEYGNMKPDVWTHHVRPALTDRNGWAWLIGVPEGRNHYFDLDQNARLDTLGEWASYTWTTEQILPLYLGAEAAAREIASAKASMDELTYNQEYRAAFVSFEGIAYYAYGTHNLRDTIEYRPDADLFLCFDFNMAPGIAVIVQETMQAGKKISCAIGEVYIPRNSNTPRVCGKIAKDWGKHKGRVLCYGDATGGAGGSAKVDGSDWDLVKANLRPVFGDRLRFRVDTHNPPERVRVNAVNSRCQAADGSIGLLIDKRRCPNLIKDFEGVRLLEGGSGELDKDTDDSLTHLTDGIGYYIEKAHPIQTGYLQSRAEQVI